MKSNEELNKKYSEFFIVPETETKIETELDLIPSVSESIAWGQPRPKKTIMSEEEFDNIFADILKETNAK
jgi:hypothetical protein